MENLEPQQDLEDTQGFRVRDLDTSRASQQYCQGKMSTYQELKKLHQGSKSARLVWLHFEKKVCMAARVQKQILQGRKPVLMYMLMWYHLRWFKFSLYLSTFHFENARVLFLSLLLSNQLRHLCLQKVARPLHVLWRRAAGLRPQTHGGPKSRRRPHLCLQR